MANGTSKSRAAARARVMMALEELDQALDLLHEAMERICAVQGSRSRGTGFAASTTA
jgi:hypothetical protein